MPRQLHWIKKGTKPKLITKHCIIFPLEAEIQRSFNLKFSLFEWIFNSLNLLRAELPHNFSELVNIPTYIFLSNTCLSLLVSTLGLVLLNFNGKIHFNERKVHLESIIQVTLFFQILWKCQVKCVTFIECWIFGFYLPAPDIPGFHE